MQGRAPAGRPRAPRDVVARAIVDRMQRDGRATTSTSTRATSAREFLERALPLDRRALPRARLRPGDRPAARRPRPALRQRRRRAPTCVGRSSLDGPLRLRRGVLHRACTGPTGWPRTRCSRAWSSPTASPTTSARGSAPAELPAGRARPSPTGPAALLDAARRVAVQAAMTAGAGAVRVGRVAGSHRAGRWPSSPLGATATEPGPQSWETTQPAPRRPAADPGGVPARGDPRRSRALRLPRARRQRWRGHLTPMRRTPTAASPPTFDPVPEQDLA